MNNFKGKPLSDYTEVHNEMINIMYLLPPESRYAILTCITKMAEAEKIFPEKDLCELELGVTHKTKQ